MTREEIERLVGNNDFDPNGEKIYKFCATVVNEKYFSEETNWGVYTMATIDSTIPYSYSEETLNYFDAHDRFQKTENVGKTLRYINVAGKMQQLFDGAEYLIVATLVENEYGKQYKPINLYSISPQTKEEQAIFLKSIISDSIAENLLNIYPNLVEDVVNGNIQDIHYDSIKGVGEKTWQKIKDKIFNNYLISDLLIMLKPLGVTTTMLNTLLKGEKNPQLLKETILNNPYTLTSIPSLGFKRVDDLALKIKPEMRDSQERLIAYVKHFFTSIGEEDGHTWCTKDVLKRQISNMVPECIHHFDWLLTNNQFVHIENERIGLCYYYNIEKNIFEYLKNKCQQDLFFEITDEQIATGIKIAEYEQGFSYVPEQLDAIKKSLKSNVSLITGCGGTGKTSISRAILKTYHVQNKEVHSAALSALAAKRIEEATGYKATTIHRMLGATGTVFLYNASQPLDVDVVFIDEGSMINASLFWSVLQAIGPSTRLVISGDHKQLPPIGYGNVFSDLLEALDQKYIHKLVKPMRQALKSGILKDANLIRENINPINESIESKLIHGELQDMYYMFRSEKEKLFNIALKTYLSTVEKEGIDNVVLITPRKEKCVNCTQEFNKAIVSYLLKDERRQFERNDGTVFKVGAKVMQIKNNYDENVFNGDIGYVVDIMKNKTKPIGIVVEFEIGDNKKQVLYTGAEKLNQVELAYCLTTHKMQGNAYKIVIGVIDSTHYTLLDNCMLYTLITRAKQRCLLLAQPKAFMRCIKTSHNDRDTWLKNFGCNNTNI